MLDRKYNAFMCHKNMEHHYVVGSMLLTCILSDDALDKKDVPNFEYDKIKSILHRKNYTNGADHDSVCIDALRQRKHQPIVVLLVLFRAPYMV